MLLFRRARLVLVAWITAAAVLFGALSPAVASVLYAGRADVAARMLGIEVQAAASVPDFDLVICRQDLTAALSLPAEAPAPHDGTPHGAPHGTHGIYCSFCLAAGSLVSLLSAGPPLPALADAAATPVTTLSPRLPLAWLAATQLARAPPSFC